MFQPGALRGALLLGIAGAAVRCRAGFAVPPPSAYVLVSLSVPGGVFRPSAADGPNLTLVRPDGEKELIRLSAEPEAGRTSWFLELAVRNFGNRATAAPFDVAIFVDGALVGSWVIAGPIATGETVRNGRIPVGPLTPGRHAVRVVIDPGNRIAESMKADNELVADIDVPPLP